MRQGIEGDLVVPHTYVCMTFTPADAARESARQTTGQFGEQNHSAPSTNVTGALSDRQRQFGFDIVAIADGGATWDSIEPFDGDEIRTDKGVELVTHNQARLRITDIGGGYPTVHFNNPFYDDFNLTVQVEDGDFGAAVKAAEWASIANDAAYKSGNIDDENDQYSVNEIIAGQGEPLRSELFVRDHTDEDSEGYIVVFDHGDNSSEVVDHNYEAVNQPGLLENIETKVARGDLAGMFRQNLADTTGQSNGFR